MAHKYYEIKLEIHIDRDCKKFLPFMVSKCFKKLFSDHFNERLSYYIEERVLRR